MNEKPVEVEAAARSNVSTTEAGKLALLLLEEAIGKQVQTISGKRDEALTQLLMAKVAGMDLRLVEQHHGDGSVSWTFESAYPGGALRRTFTTELGP